MRIAAAAATLVLLWRATGPAAAMSYPPPVAPELGNASQGQLRFYAQPSCYRGQGAKQRLELSYTVGYDQLQLLGDSAGYRGGFTFSAIAYGRHGDQVAGDSWERTIRGRDLPSLQRRDTSVWGTVKLALEPGRYRLALTCSDINSQRTGLLETELTVPDFSGGCALSDIALQRLSGGDTLPWPPARYGDIAAPLIASCEAYCRRPGTYDASVTLWSRDERRAMWQRRQPLALDTVTALRFTVPADSVVSGNYELRVAIAPADGAEMVAALRGLTIENAGRVTEKDYQSRIDQLRYLARYPEFDSLKEAQPGARDSLVAKFWSDRDPTPGTPRNEAREQYYQRIGYANQHFTVGIKAGWRTDMGQIYIRYGQPDEIERHPFEPEEPAYEIWYYYADGRKFVFSDVHGFGEYRLTYPRNERMR